MPSSAVELPGSTASIPAISDLPNRSNEPPWTKMCPSPQLERWAFSQKCGRLEPFDDHWNRKLAGRRQLPTNGINSALATNFARNKTRETKHSRRDRRLAHRTTRFNNQPFVFQFELTRPCARLALFLSHPPLAHLSFVVSFCFVLSLCENATHSAFGASLAACKDTV